MPRKDREGGSAIIAPDFPLRGCVRSTRPDAAVRDLAPQTGPFMLEAQKLAARRGFSRLFTGVSFRVERGRGPGRDRRERHRQDDTAAHAGRPHAPPNRAKSAGRANGPGLSTPGSARRLRSPGTCRRSRTSSPPRRISPRSSPSKEQRRRGRPSATHSTTSPCHASARFPRVCFRRVSAGASGSRDCRSFPGRCGSWTSPWPPSTLPAPNSWRAF